MKITPAMIAAGAKTLCLPDIETNDEICEMHSEPGRNPLDGTAIFDGHCAVGRVEARHVLEAAAKAAEEATA